MPDQYWGQCGEAHPGQVNEKCASKPAAFTRRSTRKAGMVEKDKPVKKMCPSLEVPSASLERMGVETESISLMTNAPWLTV